MSEPRGRPVFFVGMILIPVVVLGVAELGLRVIGFGESLPMWIPAEPSGAWLRMNPRVSERWFFGDVDAPGATYDPFRAERRPETFRVVVQGGSTALGFPYFYGGAFPRMLEDRLRLAFPDREVEVINTSLTAVNSHTLRDVADEIVEIDPDAVLIYAGHNEYYGALGVASTVSGGSPVVIRAYLATRELRLVQAITAIYDAITAGAAPDPESPGGTGATTMARMVAEQRIPLDSELMVAGERQLRENLDAVLERYAEAGIPVFVGTLVSNEGDHPPFIDGERDASVDWTAIERVAAESLEARDPEPLRLAVADLTNRDRTYAAGFHELGRVFETLGDTLTARTMYQGARDRDPLRFRAPTRFNDLLRELALRHGATVVESEAAFRASSPGGIIGASLLTEHLHPNLDGYYVLQNAFFEALIASGVVGTPGDDVSYSRSTIPASSVDSIYAAYLIESLTAGWPFQTDPEVEGHRVRELLERVPGSPEEELGKALFRRRIGWVDAQSRLVAGLESEQRWTEARRGAKALALEQALEWVPKAWAGTLALRAEERGDALSWFREAVEVAPPSEPVAPALLRAMEDLDSLEAVVSQHPESGTRYDLASAWALLNQPERALGILEELLADDPGNERALSLRATITAGPDQRPPGG